MKNKSGQLIAIGLIIGILLIAIVMITRKNSIKPIENNNISIEKGAIDTQTSYDQGASKELPGEKSNNILTINEN